MLVGCVEDFVYTLFTFSTTKVKKSQLCSLQIITSCFLCNGSYFFVVLMTFLCILYIFVTMSLFLLFCANDILKQLCVVDGNWRINPLNHLLPMGIISAHILSSISVRGVGYILNRLQSHHRVGNKKMFKLL